ncbi:MAG: hypothetical protein AAFR46_18930 [Pseudomonadota bacterium]
MKRLWLWIGIVVLVLVAGWSLVWLFLRGELIAALDAQEDRFRSQGDLVYESRTIGGYPFSYHTEYTGLQAATPDGVRLELPWLQGAASVFSGGAVTISLPDAIDLSFAAPPQGLAPQMRLVSDGLGIVIRFQGGGDLGYSLAADRMALFRREDAEIREALAQADEVTGFVRRDPVADRLAGELKAGLASISVATQPGASPSRATLIDPVLSLSAERAPQGGLGELIAGAVPMDARLTAAEIAVEAQAVGTVPGRLSAQGVLRALELVLRDGTAATTFELADLAAAFTPEAAGQALPPFTLDATQMGLAFDTPLRASADPVPLVVSVLLEEMAANDLAWAAFDPGAALTRSPVSLALDLGVDLRLNVDLPTVLQGATPPGQRAFDILAFRLNSLEARGLGVEIEGSGDGPLAGPQATTPQTGVVEIATSGLPELTEALEEAGLISTQDRFLARSILTVLTRPDEDTGRLVSVIASGAEGVTINGLPVATLVAALPSSQPAPRSVPNAPLPPAATPAPTVPAPVAPNPAAPVTPAAPLSDQPPAAPLSVAPPAAPLSVAPSPAPSLPEASQPTQP